MLNTRLNHSEPLNYESLNHTPGSCSPAPRSGPRPPCADRPDDWDLDTGTPETWRIAVQTCHSCPLLTQCRDLAQSLIARNQGPRAMIWAGVGYDNAGNAVASLDHHRTAPVDRKPPALVIRTATANLATTPQYRAPVDGVPVAPRRHIVLRARATR